MRILYPLLVLSSLSVLFSRSLGLHFVPSGFLLFLIRFFRLTPPLSSTLPISPPVNIYKTFPSSYSFVCCGFFKKKFSGSSLFLRRHLNFVDGTRVGLGESLQDPLMFTQNPENIYTPKV